MSSSTLPARGLPGASRPGLLPPSILWAGLALLVLPTLWKLVDGPWAGESQGHGPIILGVSLWLLWSRRGEILALDYRPARWTGGVLLATSLLAYVVGRSQAIIQFEVGALIGAAAALLLLARGWAALRLAAFPLAFMLFLVPLPGVVAQAATVPLKLAVSWATEHLLHVMGYPVARSGVILMMGQYQLLVADACAGLTSIFTLECLGLLYLNVVGHASALRNSILAVLIIPISFVANVVRVVILSLVTYHFGDAAGQGFIHGFAGIVLFAVATVLMVATDTAVGVLLARRRAR
jgi:exosortase B